MPKVPKDRMALAASNLANIQARLGDKTHQPGLAR